MGADLSRIRNNPLLDFAGVELKQGGVLLDADFNELVAIVDRRLRAAASDTLGRSTVSSTTPDAFKIAVAAGTLTIGKGRLYVDGLLAENHGAPGANAASTAFDALMAEPTFTRPMRYDAQPFLPEPPALPQAGRHLVYLDVWQREVTHAERPDLVEPAIGVETSSRLQTVWQTRVLRADAGRADCTSRDDALDGWTATIASSAARLTTGTFDAPPESDPCELPPSGGYRGLENQTYRVEIHDPGSAGGGATFKFSRDNGSVVTRAASMISAAELQLHSLGRDDVLRFNTGDWVEIIDDHRELSQRAGEMRRITVNESARHITFTPGLPADMVPMVFPDTASPAVRNLRVRRWDQAHRVLQAGAGGNTSVFQDLDAAGGRGIINVPPAGTTLLLENGVTVRFSTDASAGGGFRTGDYWVFAARTADASVEQLTEAPPRGIHHHYARLGIWDVDSGAVSDCRTPWPPRGEGGGRDCSCTQCVTVESHTSGKLTIQAAVDRVRDTGGTVCLGAGAFPLREPIDLSGARSVRIRGHGAATLIVAPAGAFTLNGGIALTIEDLAVLSAGGAPAIAVRTVLGVSLQRLIIAVLDPKAGNAAIALGGAVLGATIRDNAIVAPIAVQTMESASGVGTTTRDIPPQLLLTAALRIEDNVLWCEQQGVSLAGRVMHAMSTRITGNEILRSRTGAITVLGLAAPGASMHITGNSINIAGPGITAAVDGLRIEGNTLVSRVDRASAKVNGAGIALRVGLDPSGIDHCHLLSNQISGFTGAAIAVQAPVRALIVKQNIIERCGTGIVLQDDAKSEGVSIENNHLSDIGGSNGEAAGVVLGIGVARANSATIADNVIRRVGVTTERAALSAGVLTVGVNRLSVRGNDIGDIAPPGDFVGMAAGIMVRAPNAEVSVTLNHVDRDTLPSSQLTRSQWFALVMNEGIDKRLSSRAGMMSVVPIEKGRTLVFGMRRPFLMTAATETEVTGAAVTRGASASIVGNVLAARGMTPAVEIELSGDCLFNDNRCELRVNRAAAAVSISAGATIVSANRIKGGEVSLQLRGDVKRMTVLGNITTAGISPGPNAPFDALNVRG